VLVKDFRNPDASGYDKKKERVLAVIALLDDSDLEELLEYA